MNNPTAATPHVSNWRTFEHTQRIGRRTVSAIFFAADAAAAAVYAARRDADSRLDTDSAVATVAVVEVL
jgi:hypothetical protein